MSGEAQILEAALNARNAEARAIRERNEAAEKAERLEAALRQLQRGPETLTPDGLAIVVAALYPGTEGQ